MLILTVTQLADLAITYADAAGNAAIVDGVPTWAVSDPSVLTLNVADDGLTAEVVTVGGAGSAQVSVTADADLGDGVRSLVALLDVDVVAGEAVVATIATGAPTEKPEPVDVVADDTVADATDAVADTADVVADDTAAPAADPATDDAAPTTGPAQTGPVTGPPASDPTV